MRLPVAGFATLIVLALASLAAAQDDPGLLVYIGTGFEEPRTFVETEDFEVLDARHFHEVWWSGNGTTGNVTFRIVRGGIGGETAFRRVYEAGIGASHKEAWEPENGSYRFELRFAQYTGTADGYVWDLELAAGLGVTPPPPNVPTDPRPDGGADAPLAPSFGWLTPTLALQVGGSLVTAAVGLGGFILVRKRQRGLAERLEKIERAFEQNRNERGRCREALLALREELRGELRRNKLEERHYLLLDERIEGYLERLGGEE